MPQVICRLPNASTLIGGVKFEQQADGSMLSEEIDEAQAAHFTRISGYTLVETKPPAPPSPPVPPVVETPPPAAPDTLPADVPPPALVVETPPADVPPPAAAAEQTGAADTDPTVEKPATRARRARAE